MKNKDIKFFAVGFVVVLVGLFWFLASQSKAPAPIVNSAAPVTENSFSMVPKDSSLLIAAHSPILGSNEAPVTIVEFLDPECEACKAMYPIVKKIMSEFEGKTRLVVRYMPFHQNSRFAANILESAGAQGKYWETMNLMFQEQDIWASHHDPKPELIFTIIKSLGLDIEKIKTEAAAGKYNDIIEKDYQDGQKLGVNRTPTFFVNGEQLQEMGYEPLRDLVAKKIQAAQ